MRKLYCYKCQFSSMNYLTGQLGHFTEYVLAHSIKEAMKYLRLNGFHLGSDFVYWRLDYIYDKDN